MREISQRVGSIPASVTLAVNDRAKALQAAGHDIIALAGGDPDFDTPAHITAAALASINDGGTHYPAPMKGIPILLESIAAKMARDNHIELNPMKDIVVTPGGKWALFLALSTVLNPGDEVICLEPVWVSYVPMINLAGGTPVSISLSADNNFRVTADLLRDHVTARTKAIMVNTPCNPTGRVLTREELEAIAAVAIEADLYVIADEIYEKLIFDGRQHLSIGSLPHMAGRTLTANGMSKAYAMTGWRLGWLVGPTNLMGIAAKMNSQTVSSAAHFTMHAAAAALNGPQDFIAEMRDAYQARRDFMVKALNEIEGVDCRSIEGAFYLFPRFVNSDKDSVQLAETLLDKAGVAGTPGVAFGASGEGHVRFSIATAMRDLERAVVRIAEAAPFL